MSALDRLIATLADPPFDALLLVPEQPPVLRRQGQDRPAARTPLAGAALRHLILEIAPDEIDPAAAAWSFERRVGNRRYRFDGKAGGDGPRVRVVPLDGPVPAAAPEGAGRAPAAAPASRPEPASSPPAETPRTTVPPAAAPPAAGPRPAGPRAAVPPAAAARPVPPAAPPPTAGVAAAFAPDSTENAAEPVPPAVHPTTTHPIAAAPAAVPAAPQGEGLPPVRPGAARRLASLEPLLVDLLARGGSDLHLTTGQPPRARIDGELQVLRGYDALAADELRALLEQVTPPAHREELHDRHDTDFGFALPGRARFRANLFRDHCGLGAVFRQIPEKIPSAEDLRLPPTVAELSDLARGLVLVTGPTGSGKSTTLAAILDRANRTRSDHIITIEDPIEFVHPSKQCLVHQREVGTHTRSFAAALRAALREDPDVVLVGEMRDLETTRVAIETAETGHLVFGTLHTTSAAATVERLINQYPEGEQAQIRLMLAGTLKAVVAQTLLKKPGGGRVAAYEVLLVTPAISNLIREGKVFQIPSMMQTGRGRGMVLLDESLLALVKDEVVSAEEAYKKANDKKEFAARLRGAGVRWEGAGELEGGEGVEGVGGLRKVG